MELGRLSNAVTRQGQCAPPIVKLVLANQSAIWARPTFVGRVGAGYLYELGLFIVDGLAVGVKERGQHRERYRASEPSPEERHKGSGVPVFVAV